VGVLSTGFSTVSSEQLLCLSESFVPFRAYRFTEFEVSWSSTVSVYCLRTPTRMLGFVHVHFTEMSVWLKACFVFQLSNTDGMTAVQSFFIDVSDYFMLQSCDRQYKHVAKCLYVCCPWTKGM